MTVSPKIKNAKINIFIGLLLLLAMSVRAKNPVGDTIRKSTPEQALHYLNNLQKLEQSRWWPHIDPILLVENLKTFTVKPLAFYEGRTTNFCAYSAVTYIPLTFDPLGFAKFMVELYKKGQANVGNDHFKPSKAVRREAGLLRYKGPLDINPAGQMWFLTLADHYKGYLNFFNRRFQKGDENTFWAATNFAKFNRMLRKLCRGYVKAKGSDLIRPSLNDLPGYLQSHMKRGLVFLYLNNKKLYRKSHTKSLISTPTHYVLLTNIHQKPDGIVEFEYWNYGMRTVQQLSPDFLKNIIYGVSVWSPNKLKK